MNIKQNNETYLCILMATWIGKKWKTGWAILKWKYENFWLLQPVFLLKIYCKFNLFWTKTYLLASWNIQNTYKNYFGWLIFEAITRGTNLRKLWCKKQNTFDWYVQASDPRNAYVTPRFQNSGYNRLYYMKTFIWGVC